MNDVPARRDAGLAGPPSDPAAEPLVAIREVAFDYDGQPIIRGLDLGVAPGSVVAVVGPSGSGKTTLLSLLAGLLEPASGAVVWNQHLMQPGRHPLSMLFQKDTLLPWLTVADNIGLHHRLTGSRLSKAERRDRIAELVALAGLQGAETKYPYQLSGGMRRRAAFLATVLPRPHLLLLDEPFAAVDEPTRVAIHQDIRSIVKSYDITVVLVTHDIAEAVSLADEVVILTHRPARVSARHTVPFEGHRDMLALRDDPRFLTLYGTLWEELGEQVRAARDPGSTGTSEGGSA